MKRTTSSDEYERVSERIYNRKGTIRNREDFNRAFSKTLNSVDLTDEQKDFRDKVFKEYTDRHVIPYAEEHIKEQGRIERIAITTKNLNVVSRKKGKVVYSQKVYVRIKNKEFIRYRDSKGQFTSVKK